MERRYTVLDVFTDKPLAGNQLAVVFDSDGLDTKQMQTIAREFNLSETVFVFPATEKNHTASIRIFTPGLELPFAGHPTVGAAIALAAENSLEQTGQGIVILEEGVGPVRCGVRFEGEKSFAEFDLPVVAKEVAKAPSKEEIAAALSLSPSEIGFENHKPTVYSGGVPYTYVPVRDARVAGKVSIDSKAWIGMATQVDGVPADPYVYCRATVDHNARFHARMFAPYIGIPEDPATGSAVAGLAGVIQRFDDHEDGQHTLIIEQGIEMGRPSKITLEIEIENGELVDGRIGGYAAFFARGTFEA